MTSAPLEASQIERFTPPSLANLPSPPVFLLKPASRRERHLREEWLLERRARFHSVEDQRDQILIGLRAYWDEDAAERFVPIVKQYWDALDQHDRRVRDAGDGEAPEFVFDGPVGVGELEKLFADLAEVDDRYNRMLIDNRSYMGKSAMATMAFTIVGWEGIDARYGRVAGATSEDAIDDAVAAMMTIEGDDASAGIEGIGKPGTAMLELAARCSELMFLSEAQRKNLQSPSPSMSSPAASTKDGAATKAASGKSRSPAPSPKTLDA